MSHRPVTALALLLAACSHRPAAVITLDAGPDALAEEPAARLEFRVQGRTVRVLTLGELTARVAATTSALGLVEMTALMAGPALS